MLLIFTGTSLAALFTPTETLTDIILKAYFMPLWVPLTIFVGLDGFCAVNALATRRQLLAFTTKRIASSMADHKRRTESTTRRLFYFCVVKIGTSTVGMAIVTVLMALVIAGGQDDMLWWI